MSKLSYIDSADGSYIEGLYQTYQSDPKAVDKDWAYFFEGFDFALGAEKKPMSTDEIIKELKVYSLIEGYRKRGHLLSTTNPIRPRRNRYPNLTLEQKGLSEDDLPKKFNAGHAVGIGEETLSGILDHLKKVYTANIGIEFKHIQNYDEMLWVRDKFENRNLDYGFSIDKKNRILSKLNQSVVFEKFLGTKFVGQKRFSLEGGENTIPALDALINKASELNAEEIVIGMAHRGRLNVLANILGKTYNYIFGEFEGNIDISKPLGDGDVKYHLGFSSEVDTISNKKIRLHLVANPSHLEAVDPVVEGYVRAKQDAIHQGDEDKIVPILIHGDSAVAGQGVVYEVLQMSQLKGYHTGGTIHFVINNQVGFTTDFDDARTSTYSTSIATTVDSPVLHVNGDDAEAVVYAVEFATEYRQKFHKDVWIDMVCYRKHGHNESDEPRFTQPTFYSLIAKHPDPRTVYSNQLVQRGEIEAQLAKKLEKEFKALLQDRLNEVKERPLPYTVQPLEKEWHQILKNDSSIWDKPDTSVNLERLEKVITALTVIPETIKPITKITKLLTERRERFDTDKLDWALGELLAYGTLLEEGFNVRLSGQDVIRGTFSHRHACVFDQNTDEKYNSLNHIAENQVGEFKVFNSNLSEFGVLGFEYGYSMVSPKNLVIWEAQFGDFSNGAQVMIDQFVVSSESKWQRMSGLVMLLPHGYEGEGPEHSNARPERYLQLAAEDNIVVANITTPANYFHLLRRQMHWAFRKPLIVFTPKSLLRSPLAVSSKDELINGQFTELIEDTSISAELVKKVLFCTGKVYYDLIEKREQDGINDTLICRVEQLYPFPESQLEKIISKYPKATYKWVQEEPKNMGAWTFLLRYDIMRNFELVSRKASASPATGFKKVHKQEQEFIITKAFE